MKDLQEKTITKMSSREIADLTGKQHSHVKRDIYNIVQELNYPNLESSPFEHNGNTYNEYLLDKELTLILVSGYSVQIRAKIIKRWQELEQAPVVHQIPQTLSEALQLAADQARQLELAAPKIEFVDNYVTAKDTKCLSDVAKLVGIPRNTFCKMLSDDKIIFKRDGDYRPFSRYEQYFTMKTGSSGDRTWVQCRVNSEGVVYLSKRYGMEG